jgi:DNA-binding MarR family transcriptional regulator
VTAKADVSFAWSISTCLKSSNDDLGSTQRLVLDFIKQHNGCTQTEIVNALGKKKSQISIIISKLCREGYLINKDNALFINTPC